MQGRRRLAAEQAAAQARASLEEATSLAPELREVVTQLAEQNAQLAEQRIGEEGLVEKIDEVGQKLARAREHVAEVEADFADIARKVQAVGLADSVGLALRRQRSKAPELGKYRRFIRMRQELIRAVQLHQLELREQRFSYTAELVWKLLRNGGVRWAEVPVSYRFRSYGEGKKIGRAHV